MALEDWESDGSTVGSAIVEVWEEPTRHVAQVKKLLSWLKVPGKFPPEEQRKAKLRILAKCAAHILDLIGAKWPAGLHLNSGMPLPFFCRFDGSRAKVFAHCSE